MSIGADGTASRIGRFSLGRPEASRSDAVRSDAVRLAPEESAAGVHFERTVDALCALNESPNEQRGRQVFPSRPAVAGIVDDLRAVLYPRHFGAAGLAARSLRYLIGVRVTRSVPPGSRVTQAQARQAMFENGSGI